jgi:hypothetical protein
MSEILSKIYVCLHVTYTLFVTDFKDTSIFLTYFREILELKITKFCPVGTELLHAHGQTDSLADGQTDTTKLIVAFRNFVNAPKNYSNFFFFAGHFTNK